MNYCVHINNATKTKFSETWLSSVDSNGQRIGEWCRKGQHEYQGYCQFCNVQVKCGNAGKAQLLQHSKQKKHIDAIKQCVDNTQRKLVAFSKQSGESFACSSQSLGINYAYYPRKFANYTYYQNLLGLNLFNIKKIEG